MKPHLISGLIIGATINVAFQLTDTAHTINLIELLVCALVAALAAFTAALVQRQRPAQLHPQNRPTQRTCHLTP